MADGKRPIEPAATGNARVGALVLAAGRSRRAGTFNKLLYPVDGEPMIRHVVRRLTSSAVDDVVVVTGHDAGSIGAALTGIDGIRLVHHAGHANGMAGSLAAGLVALAEHEAALIVLGDMPDIGAPIVDALLGARAALDRVARPAAIVVPTCDEQRGNPILIGRAFFDRLGRLQGDVGAREVIRAHPDAVLEVEVGDAAILRDHDTPDALRALDGRRAAAGGSRGRTVPSNDRTLLDTAMRWLDAGHRVELVTVARTWGSSPRPVGSMAAVRGDGRISGSVSGGCVETRLVEAAEGRTHTSAHVITDEEARRVGLTCGGRLELVFEPVDDASTLAPLVQALDDRRRMVRRLDVVTQVASLEDADGDTAFDWNGRVLQRVFGPAWRVLLVGAGELSRHVAAFALALDFDVIVCEPRAPFRDSFDVAGVQLVDLLPDDAVACFARDARSAVLALSHEPSLDDLALEAALGADCFHVAALGSTRSHARRLQRLAFLGVDAVSTARISAPAGLAIGSRTAAEIGVSIAAELVARRAGVREGRARAGTPDGAAGGPAGAATGGARPLR